MKTYDYIFIGGGLSGLMTAYYMCQDVFFKEKSILILDKSPKNTNDKTWCYWHDSKDDWDFLAYKKWNQVLFRSDVFSKIFSIEPYQYKMIRSIDFYEFVIGELQKNECVSFIYDEISEISENAKEIIVTGKQASYTGKQAFNSLLNIANLEQASNLYPYLKQHFVGWFIQTPKAVFNEDLVTFMDFSIPQQNNTRFIYILPFTENKALVEYTLFSNELLPFEEYEKGIEDYLKSFGIDSYTILEKEQGNIPMTAYSFQQKNTKRLWYIGSAGGWTKASTGYTFYNTAKESKNLIENLKGDSVKQTPKRHAFYDAIFIEVLYHYNYLGRKIFTSLFKKNTIQSLFSFLNSESDIYTELKIIASAPTLPFLKSFFKFYYKKLTISILNKK